MQQTSVILHGDRVSYRQAGDPNNPVLLLIHGITSSSATWDPVIPKLAEHSHVIAPDLFGHGDSDKQRSDYSLGGFATQLRDLLDHLGYEGATVVGHSLGGGVAMQFSYQYFDYCERLILVDSGGLGREVSMALRAGTMPGVELILPVIANRHVRNATNVVGRALSKLPLRPHPRPSTLELARGYSTLAESPSRMAFVHTLRSVVEPGGQRVSALERLYLTQGRPTLIIWGARDTVIPVAHGQHAHESIPGSLLEIFEQSEHFPHMDEPGRFARVVNEFMASTEPLCLDRQTVRQRMAERTKSLHEEADAQAEALAERYAQGAADAVAARAADAAHVDEAAQAHADPTD
ncbi:MAG: alpha/beta hydrolase [Candidatus Nanopelagicales bacterium]